MSMLPFIINDTWGGYFVLCALNLCAIGDSTVLGQGPGGQLPPSPPTAYGPACLHYLITTFTNLFTLPHNNIH